ncbi:MAG: aminotransferase class I/II-fold pyridoxal phosphate-dependent enzyme [Anaerolineae bacterium]|nr:aminotransferase class I/II-fold pyridoxal phosphate-dependent enzyme [Anaerolineae bacterium]
MPRIATRMDHVPPYLFARVNARIAELEAKTGRRVINLGIGSPDLPTPGWIIDILAETARNPLNHRYPSYVGLPAFRQAVVTYYERRFGVGLDVKTEVVPLIGSKEGLAHATQAWAGAGDVVLVPDPGYPTYKMAALLCDAEPVMVPLDPARGWLPDFTHIPADKLARATMLWANYPNNPTGAIADLDALAEMVAWCKAHDVWLAFDNPYCDLVYDGYAAPSILNVPGAKDIAIEFNSLSKTYNMAGWRIGMAVGNARALEALNRVKNNVDTGIPNAIQYAAAAALTGDQGWLEGRNAVYASRRDVVVRGLNAVGLKADLPKASLYVWAQAPEGWEDDAFAMYALEQAGVWLTPGREYGDQGKGYLRASLAVTEADLDEAMTRLKTLDLAPVHA